jgi:hypothetical protein
MSLLSDMLAAIKNLAGRAVGKVPLGKIPHGKFLFIGLGAVLFILIICLLTVVALINRMNRIPDSPVQALQPSGLQLSGLQPQIPPDELFFPEEPDFLPGVILERERRDSWTAEDAAPFWYNPLETGEEQWWDRVEAVIDELLEHVP